MLCCQVKRRHLREVLREGGKLGIARPGSTALWRELEGFAGDCVVQVQEGHLCQMGCAVSSPSPLPSIPICSSGFLPVGVPSEHIFPSPPFCFFPCFPSTPCSSLSSLAFFPSQFGTFLSLFRSPFSFSSLAPFLSFPFHLAHISEG